MVNNEPSLGLKRATAYKLCIRDIVEGSYIRAEQAPNFLLTKDDRKVFRVNLIAILVEKLMENTWLLEDDTGRITLRSFNQMPEGFNNGDVVLVIGKPREIAGEKYIIHEIIKKLDSYSWLKLRSLELKGNYRKVDKNEEVNISQENLVKDANLDSGEDIYETIKKLDKGDGVDVSFLVEKLGSKTEKTISKLLEHGEIFEIRPGKLKVLE